MEVENISRDVKRIWLERAEELGYIKIVNGEGIPVEKYTTEHIEREEQHE